MRESSFLSLTAALGPMVQPAFAFEGRINATLVRGGKTQRFFYTAGTNYLRLERGETNWPHARNILNLQTGDLTLLFPHNRSFVRLKASHPNAAPQGPGLPLPAGIDPQPQAATPASVPALPPPPNMPTLPPGIGPQVGATPGAAPMPEMSGMGAMPMRPTPRMENLELKATDDKTNLLGLACIRYEVKQRGETLEVWATDQLLPFQPYLPGQPARCGPRMIDEQWAGLLKDRKLFPLRATLRFDHGVERFRFDVKSVTPETIADSDGELFQPPPEYHEVQPLPF